MDIDLLSKMVKELILDNDRVVLQGLGCFVAEMVPATFSDKGYTINPPYRRLFFRSKPDVGDELTTFYADSNKVEPAIADRIIREFLEELKKVLYERKVVVFPGLGRLRATKENHLFFVADEELDIYPSGFGLEPVSLKTHKETPEQVTAAVEDLKNILKEVPSAVPAEEEPEVVMTQETVETEVTVEEPIVAESGESVEELPQEALEEPVAVEKQVVLEEPEVVDEPVVENVPASEDKLIVEETVEEPAVDEEPEPAAESVIVVESVEKPEEVKESAVVNEPEVVEESVVKVETCVVREPEVADKTSRPRTLLKAAVWTVALVAAAFAVFVILGRTCPDLVDPLLYTPEELEIVRTIE